MSVGQTWTDVDRRGQARLGNEAAAECNAGLPACQRQGCNKWNSLAGSNAEPSPGRFVRAVAKWAFVPSFPSYVVSHRLKRGQHIDD